MSIEILGMAPLLAASRETAAQWAAWYGVESSSI